MKEIIKIRDQLTEKIRKESMRLFRLAWKAEQHGCSKTLVEEIRNEARWLDTTAQVYPEKVLCWDFEYKYEYKFKYMFRLGGK